MKHQLTAAGEVLMTPDGSVSWNSYDVPRLDGRLYLSPSAPPNTANTLLDRAEAGVLPEGSSNLDGTWARVQNFGGMALKVFKPETMWPQLEEDNDYAAGVFGMRAHVLMQTDLQRVQKWRLARGRLRVASPQLFGAFVANDWYLDEPRTPAVWAMSFENGQRPNDLNDVIPMEARHALYARALASCGVDDLSALFLGDDQYKNALLADDGKRLVRLDFMATGTLREYF